MRIAGSSSSRVHQLRPLNDVIASTLMRYRDQNGQGWADFIDCLTMYPNARRRVVQLLGELEATTTTC